MNEYILASDLCYRNKPPEPDCAIIAIRFGGVVGLGHNEVHQFVVLNFDLVHFMSTTKGDHSWGNMGESDGAYLKSLFIVCYADSLICLSFVPSFRAVFASSRYLQTHPMQGRSELVFFQCNHTLQDGIQKSPSAPVI